MRWNCAVCTPVLQGGGHIMFRLYEWNFSATAEAVVGVLLALTIVSVSLMGAL